MSSAVAVPVIFVRLKLSLLRNGVRQTTGRSAAFLGSVVLSLLVGGLTLLGMVALRGSAHVVELSVVLVALIGLGWAFLPLFVGGADETLDPGRLAMLPLSPRALLAGQLAASVVGPGPLFSLLLLSGSAVAVAESPAGWLMVVVAVPLVLLVCTTLTRSIATANARLLSSRRGRDLAILSGIVVVFGIQALNLGLSRLSEENLGALGSLAGVLGWVPPATGITAVRAASDGSYGVALGALAATGAALALLLGWWGRTLTRLMTAPDASTSRDSVPEKVRGGAGLAWSRWLPEGRAGAAMDRSLRYAWRDPKTKMGWVMALGMGLLFPVVWAAQGNSSVYQSCWASGMLGLLMFNQFGQDYSGFWLVAGTIADRRDALAELRGRALAIAVVAVPFTTAVVVLSAVLLGAPSALPDALGIALAALGALLATGAAASARFPYSVPQDNPMKNVAPGQGSVAWAGILAGLASAAVLCAPLIALTMWLHGAADGLVWTILPLGTAYGLLLTLTGLHLAARWTADRLPEILTAVSRG
ncbi:transporter [Streptomyces mayteni]